MTVSEFDTLRADILALRGEIVGLDSRLADIETRLTRVESKLDEKPGVAMLYQVAFGAPIALVGFTAAVATLAKAAGVI